jgi:hypothetical protein
MSISSSRVLSRAGAISEPFLQLADEVTQIACRETRMQDIPTATEKRAPSSRVLQEVIRQAPAEYVTVGWLTSTLHRHSFGMIMLSLGLLATTPVGSSVPGLILAVGGAINFGSRRTCFPAFYHDATLAD